MSNRSTIDVEWVPQGRGGEWMVVQRMNVEDAREVAYAFDPRDGVVTDLFAAADEAEQKNEREAR